MARSSAGESVLSRAVRVLDVFDSGSRDLSLAEIARRAGLAVSSSQAIVENLCSLGLLERGDNRRYRIGVRLWELAARSPGVVGLRQIALPTLQQMQATVRQYTQLAILQNTEVLYLERLSDGASIVNIAAVGARFPVHATSSGMVLAAYSPPEVQDRIVAVPRTRFALASAVSDEQLRAQFVETRAAGYSVTRGYITSGAAAVAVPVLDYLGDPIAAVAFVVPIEGAQGAALEVYISRLREGARRISADLRRGHLNRPPGPTGASS